MPVGRSPGAALQNIQESCYGSCWSEQQGDGKVTPNNVPAVLQRLRPNISLLVRRKCERRQPCHALSIEPRQLHPIALYGDVVGQLLGTTEDQDDAPDGAENVPY